MMGALLTLLGYLAGISVFVFEARRKNLATSGIFAISAAALGFGMLGAKLSELLITGSLRTNPRGAIDPSVAGKTIIGGLIFGWVGVFVVKRALGIRRSSGDLFAPGIALGEAIGRIGCFLNGCCYGIESSSPWAVYQHGAWREPSQLFFSANALAIFAILMFVRNHVRREGDLFRLYLFLYCSTRFLLEFLREREIVLAGMSLAQLVCIVGILLLAAYFAIRNQTERKEAPA